MLYEQFGRTELHSRLPESGTEIRLTAYARPRSGLLADGGGALGGAYPARRRVSGDRPHRGARAGVSERGNPGLCAGLQRAARPLALAASGGRRSPGLYPEEQEKYERQAGQGITVYGLLSPGAHLARCLANPSGATALSVRTIRSRSGRGPARPRHPLLPYRHRRAYAIREWLHPAHRHGEAAPGAALLREASRRKIALPLVHRHGRHRPVENTMLYAWALPIRV